MTPSSKAPVETYHIADIGHDIPQGAIQTTDSF